MGQERTLQFDRQIGKNTRTFSLTTCSPSVKSLTLRTHDGINFDADFVGDHVRV